MATDSSDRVIMEKTVLPLFSAVFHPILFILEGNDDMHWSSEEKFSQIRPPTAELAALERLEKKRIYLYLGKWCSHFFSPVLDRIHFILAGHDDIHVHEKLDEF